MKCCDVIDELDALTIIMQTHLLFLFTSPINMNIHVQSDLASCIYKDEIKYGLYIFAPIIKLSPF
jgi:hypothetical protein